MQNNYRFWESQKKIGILTSPLHGSPSVLISHSEQSESMLHGNDNVS